jgi:hypothetical protein
MRWHQPRVSSYLDALAFLSKKRMGWVGARDPDAYG